MDSQTQRKERWFMLQNKSHGAGEVAQSNGLASQAGGHKFILLDPMGES